jgi:protein disulfide-isomerase-like protein
VIVSFKEEWKTGTWLVKFYAPWCGYCKRFEPIWDDVGKTLADTTVQVARLDCTKFKETAGGFGIHGLPTVKLFHKGHEYDYEGRRDTKPIVEFVQRATGPAVIKVTDLRELSRQMKLKDVLYLLLYDESSSDAMAVYQSIAQQHVMNSWFYESSDEDIRTHLQVLHGWELFVLKDGGQYAYDRSNGLNKDKMSSWILAERFVAMAHIDHAMIDDYARTGKLLVMLSLGDGYRESQVHKNTYRTVQRIAMLRKYHSEFCFVFTSNDFVIQRISLGSVSTPCLIVVNFTSHQYYPLSKAGENVVHPMIWL